GDTEGGQTIHWLDPGMDSGDIIAQRALPIDPEDTGATFGQKLVEMGVPFFLETWPLIRRGEAPRTKQDDALATYCAAPKPEDWIIPWHEPARRVHNHVRGFGPPGEGAVTFFQGRRVRVLRTRVADPPLLVPGDGVPGQVLGGTGEGILVRTGEGVVAILDARFEDDGSSLLAGPVLGPWCVLGRA
ncbi:MAG: formyltransferase family protein, partial [Armatimonadota bacterium]|nr:formyltransferase family protein [Armatimonadota bacterium]